MDCPHFWSAFEPGMAMINNMKTGNFMKDMQFGLPLMLKGKASMFPTGSKDAEMKKYLRKFRGKIMTKYAFYPGCSLETGGIEYRMSSHAVAKALGIELLEVPDWNCCGASSAHMTDHLLSLALPARILALAETLPVTKSSLPVQPVMQDLPLLNMNWVEMKN